MIVIRKSNTLRGLARAVPGLALIWAVCAPSAVLAQDRDRDRYADRVYDRITRIEPGMVIAVRTNEFISTDRGDGRIYTGVVDQDVRGDNGRLAIPRGSRVELLARVAPDNDLVLDLDSVTVNGDRYAVRAASNRVESRRDDNVVGAIVGALGGEVRGRNIRIPRDSVLTFRIVRPLDMGVADEGYMRDGGHYHPYRDYRDRR